LLEGEPTELRAVWRGGNGGAREPGEPDAVTISTGEPDALERAADLNRRGYEAFFIFNQPDPKRLERGQPTRDQDIKRFDAFGLDFDTPTSPGESHLERLEGLPCAPSWIVQTSPGRFHAYWQTSDPVSPDEGQRITRALCRKLEADPKATSAAQLLRLPGFLNWKGRQTAAPSQIVGGTGLAYSSAVVKQLAGIKRGDRQRRKPESGATLISVQDGTGTHPKGLDQHDQKRLENQRRAHAKERAAHRRASPIRRTRQPSPLLPAPLATALKNCETAEGYADTLRRLWPRTPGCRHMLALASGVELYRYGLTLDAARAVVKSACKGAGDQEESADRLRAVTDAYRAAHQGQRVTGTGSGAPMTVFGAEHYGPDLRTLPSDQRPAERIRRVWAVLESIPPTDAGIRPSSCRTLAERTGLSKNAVSATLRELEREGRIKRSRLGVEISAADQLQKRPDAPETPTPHDQDKRQRGAATGAARARTAAAGDHAPSAPAQPDPERTAERAEWPRTADTGRSTQRQPTRGRGAAAGSLRATRYRGERGTRMEDADQGPWGWKLSEAEDAELDALLAAMAGERPTLEELLDELANERPTLGEALAELKRAV
jgi:hypothetical protein